MTRRLQAARSVQVRRAIETGADCSRVETLRDLFNLDHSALKAAGTRLRPADYRGDPKGVTMKLATIAFAAACMLSASFAYAQSGAPSGRGSTSGDPAASSATPGSSPTTGSSMKPSTSGSGTSTSGGSDANGDQGRDKMPESSQGVRPLDKQNKP
jgi:hypothetical protein